MATMSILNSAFATFFLSIALWLTAASADGVTRYVRYAVDGVVSYGILEGDSIRELSADYFSSPKLTGKTMRLADVKLLAPLDPMKVQKVLGVAGNYTIPGRQPRAVPHPRWFAKMPTSINRPEGGVEVPPEASNLNSEGELVLVIGRKARMVPVAEAPAYIFGVTVGNDISENGWYGERKGVDEPSRMIAKSMDTWACLGPAIVAGLDYRDLRIDVRLNGTLVATGRTSDMVNRPAVLVSYLTRFVTLMPGDIIYTGTVAPPSLPGQRREMKPGDIVEVEIEKVGLLRNTFVPMKTDNQIRTSASR